MNSTGKSSVRIRPMTQSDIDPVLGLWWSPVIPDKDMLAAQLKGPLHSSFVAELDGRVVGFILARLQYLGIPTTGVCVTYAVAVQPEYRRQGIGRQLLTELKNHCGNKGVSTMRVVVPEDDTHLMNYFQQLGFKRSNMINLEQPCGGEA
ncbi:MAG: N-acetyltransferase family protein [Dehalococcoidia bacterium]